MIAVVAALAGGTMAHLGAFGRRQEKHWLIAAVAKTLLGLATLGLNTTENARMNIFTQNDTMSSWAGNGACP